jgi:hypothetical protein
MSRTKMILLTGVLAALGWTATVAGAGGGVERLYVLD